MQPLKITGTINQRLDRSPERTEDTMFIVDLTVTPIEPETDADKFRNKSPMHKALLECEERCLELEEKLVEAVPNDAAILMARRVIEEAVPVLENLYDYCKRDIPEAKAMHALSVLNKLRSTFRILLAWK